MRLALVTGAGGFVGRWVVRALRAAGWNVLGVDRRPDPSAEGIRWVVADITSEALREEADVVIHLAFPARAALADDAAARAAVEAMDRGVIRAASRSRLAVIVSSAAVYGDNLRDGPGFHERVALAPTSTYGRVKVEQEARWRAAVPAERLLIARPFNLTGPGEPPALVVRALADRLRGTRAHAGLPVRRSASVRDFLDVRDAAGAIASLLAVGTGGTVNICSGVPVSVAEVARRLLAVAGRTVPLESDGQGGESRSVGDATALRQRTDWRPRYGLDDTLRAVWQEACQCGGREAGKVP